MLLIGSRALNMHCKFAGISYRDPVDWDYISTYEDFNERVKYLKKLDNVKIKSIYPLKNKIIIKYYYYDYTIPVSLTEQKSNIVIEEHEIAWPGSSAEDILHMQQKNPTYQGKYHIADLNTLFLLKWSHRFLKNSPHFLKTRLDIDFLQIMPGLRVLDESILFKREMETYTYSHPKLNVKKNDFFVSSESLKYIYDHDSIHESIKIYDRPAYTFYLKDGQEVMCDYKKFYDTIPGIQLASVYEEAAVLALERSQIPFNFKPDEQKSFEKALEKVCTSITSGWYRDYAYANYFNVLKLKNIQPINYVERFKEALDKNQILPFREKYDERKIKILH